MTRWGLYWKVGGVLVEACVGDWGWMMCPWESIILFCLLSCTIENIYHFLDSSAFKVQFKCHLTRLKADLFLFSCLTQLSLLQTHNRVLLLCVSLCICFPFPPSPGDPLMSCTLPGCCSVNIYWITWKEIPGYIKRIFHKTHQLPTPPTTPGEETSEIGTVFSFPRVGRLRPGTGPRQAESRVRASLVVMVTHSGPPHKKSATCPGSPFRASSGWRALSEGSALHELSSSSRAFLSASETSKKVLSVWIRSGCVNASQ